jgi:hypothetical protein
VPVRRKGIWGNFYIRSLESIRNEVTCKIVSKLNVKPFHSVNSPELAPVTKRRPEKNGLYLNS